jgi:hypothetical protein
MRMTASTLSDDHLLLVLATAEADGFAKRNAAGANAGRHHYRADAATARAGQYGRRYSPARCPQLARYALLLLVDLLNDTLMA